MANIRLCSIVSLKEIKELIKSETELLKKHSSEIQQKYSELEKSFGFLSSKYDQLLNQTKTSNKRLILTILKYILSLRKRN